MKENPDSPDLPDDPCQEDVGGSGPDRFDLEILLEEVGWMEIGDGEGRDPLKVARLWKRIALERKVWVLRRWEEANELRIKSWKHQEKAEEWKEQAERLRSLGRDEKADRAMARGQRYWDWALQASDMAETRESDAQYEWVLIADDLKKAAEALEQAGKFKEAAQCLIEAADILNPFSLKPWLIPLLEPEDAPHLDDRAKRHEESAQRLREAADHLDRSGQFEEARRLREEARRRERAAIDDYERAAEGWTRHDMPEMAEESKANADRLR